MHLSQRPDNSKGPATRNDFVDDIVDVSSSTMAFNVAKIASARASLTISLTKSLRVAGPLMSSCVAFGGIPHLTLICRSGLYVYIL